MYCTNLTPLPKGDTPADSSDKQTSFTTILAGVGREGRVVNTILSGVRWEGVLINSILAGVGRIINSTLAGVGREGVINTILAGVRGKGGVINAILAGVGREGRGYQHHFSWSREGIIKRHLSWCREGERGYQHHFSWCRGGREGGSGSMLYKVAVATAAAGALTWLGRTRPYNTRHTN